MHRKSDTTAVGYTSYTARRRMRSSHLGIPWCYPSEKVRPDSLARCLRISKLAFGSGEFRSLPPQAHCTGQESKNPTLWQSEPIRGASRGALRCHRGQEDFRKNFKARRYGSVISKFLISCCLWKEPSASSRLTRRVVVVQNASELSSLR